MIVVILIILGLALGSFVNALVWRVHQQEAGKKSKELSILHGRSMCPDCKHQLAAKDLVPLLSWLTLKGKCRYCGRPVSKQYPLVELATALAFVASYLCWPDPLRGWHLMEFVVWLPILTGLMALLVYDLKWMILPTRIIYPLACLAVVMALAHILAADHPLKALLNIVLAVVVGGGIFYLLYIVSNGKWIGGGDIRLGWLLGVVVATPARSLLFIFLASLLGTLASMPLLVSKRLKRSSVIPFGPFLIIGAALVVLFGHDILNWYQRTFFAFTL